MKRELSKDEKIQLGAKIFCGVLCVSLVSGTFAYYTMEEKKAQERIAYEIENGLNGYEPIEETKNEVLESLMAEPLSDKQKAQIDKNTVVIDTEKENAVLSGIKQVKDKFVSSFFSERKVLTGCDKNGNPYLKEGASYTFHPDGTPVEAPPDGRDTSIVHNGKGYLYSEWLGKWAYNDTKEKQERINAIGRREISASGVKKEDDVPFTKEEIDNWTKNMVINVGSIK